jgi:dTDP-4-dehydrorhamnose 3,5-epimerase
MIDLNKLQIVAGNVITDDRGSVSFINDFNFEGVKRFYSVTNHRSQFVRAWHGHKKEAKFVSVIQGAALIGAVKIDSWDSPSRDLEVNKYILTDKKPSILYIPPGYANGFMTLGSDTRVIFYSTSTLEESAGDDFRFNSRLWNIWEVEER